MKLALLIRLAKLYNVSIDYIAKLADPPAPLHGTNMYRKQNSRLTLTQKVKRLLSF